MREKRAADRVVPSRPVTLALERRGGTPLTYGIIEDISSCGARVVSDVAPPVGQWVGVALSFPKRAQIFETRGLVVWLRPGSVAHWGVQFESAPAQHAEQLRELIDGVSTVPPTSH